MLSIATKHIGNPGYDAFPIVALIPIHSAMLGGPGCEDGQSAVVKVHCGSLGRVGEGWLLCPLAPTEGDGPAGSRIETSQGSQKV